MHDGAGNQSHLEEMYGTEMSPTLIFSVTEAVTDEVKAWQARPLDALFPMVYLDCIHAKVRDSGAVRVKAVYLALGVNLNGDKDNCRRQLPSSRAPLRVPSPISSQACVSDWRVNSS
jgi:hypothetical protein